MPGRTGFGCGNGGASTAAGRHRSRAVALGELAEALGAERTILTRNLSLIEGASWVEIQPAEDDARSRIVTVTDKGHAVVAGRSPPGVRLKTAAIGSDGASALRGLARAALR